MNSATATDTSMAQLATLMERRLNGRVRNLRLHCQPQGLVLQGWAPTYYVKQLAQHAAMEVSELPILANEIEVQ